MEQKENNRNSAGVRVSDDVFLNVWTSQFFGFPENQDLYRSLDGDDYLYRSFAEQCLHQGLVPIELSVSASAITYRDELGRNGRVFGLGNGLRQNIEVEMRKPCDTKNVLFGTEGHSDRLKLDAAYFVHHGRNFAIITNDNKLYINNWYDMIKSYQAISVNIKREHAIDLFTRKFNFPSNDGPVSMYELASKALREDKEAFCGSPANAEVRVGGGWVPIEIEDIMPGMDVRFGSSKQEFYDVKAVEYRDGQLTVVTDKEIFCSNDGFEKALEDLKNIIRREANKDYSEEEWAQMFDAHKSRFDALAKQFEKINEIMQEQFQQFEAGDLERDEEYFAPDYP